MKTDQWIFYIIYCLISIEMNAVAIPMRVSSYRTTSNPTSNEVRPAAINSSSIRSYRCLVIEVSQINHILMDFHLIGEHSHGTSHIFEYRLNLGNEQYTGSGSSKRKAQETISEKAFNTTNYRKPDMNKKSCIIQPSPVNRLQEWAIGRNIQITYVVANELRGPPKKYLMQCLLIEHNLTSSGEGTNKKQAKAMAAQNMLTTLERMNIIVNTDETFGLKYLKLVKYNTTVSALHHPISRLFEIQSIRHAAEPIFRQREVVDMGEPNLKMYLYQISVGTLRDHGNGKSPKEAKKNAARNMLKQMGFLVNNKK